MAHPGAGERDMYLQAWSPPAGQGAAADAIDAAFGMMPLDPTLILDPMTPGPKPLVPMEDTPNRPHGSAHGVAPLSPFSSAVREALGSPAASPMAGDVRLRGAKRRLEPLLGGAATLFPPSPPPPAPKAQKRAQPKAKAAAATAAGAKPPPPAPPTTKGGRGASGRGASGRGAAAGAKKRPPNAVEVMSVQLTGVHDADELKRINSKTANVDRGQVAPSDAIASPGTPGGARPPGSVSFIRARPNGKKERQTFVHE